jgi:hypothetical protein
VDVKLAATGVKSRRSLLLYLLVTLCQMVHMRFQLKVNTNQLKAVYSTSIA